MLSKDAIEQIQTTAVEAAAPQQLPVLDQRRLSCVINGKVVTIPQPPPPRMHVAQNLDSLVRFAIALVVETDWEVTCPPGAPAIWHGENRINLLCDADDRRDRVILELPFSRPFGLLMDLNTETARWPQKYFVATLECKLDIDASVIDPFRKLNWSRNSSANAEFDRAKEYLAQEILSKVHSPMSELPELITVPVEVYDVAGCRVSETVRCRVLVDVQNHTLALVPLPGEITRAIDGTHDVLHERIQAMLAKAQVEIPVYYGTP